MNDAHQDAHPSDDVVPVLAEVVRSLVDHPGAVHIAERQRGRNTVLTLKVDPRDVGQVIGRQGRTARALRALLEARGAEEGRSYGLEIRRS